MTVSKMAEKLSLTPLNISDPDREFSGVYIGDLLSWVMGRAESGDLWITIMSNINIVAVAALADTAAIILAEDVSLSDDVLSAAKAKGVNIYKTRKTAYGIAYELARL